MARVVALDDTKVRGTRLTGSWYQGLFRAVRLTHDPDWSLRVQPRVRFLHAAQPVIPVLRASVLLLPGGPPSMSCYAARTVKSLSVRHSGAAQAATRRSAGRPCGEKPGVPPLLGARRVHLLGLLTLTYAPRVLVQVLVVVTMTHAQTRHH